MKCRALLVTLTGSTVFCMGSVFVSQKGGEVSVGGKQNRVCFSPFADNVEKSRNTH